LTSIIFLFLTLTHTLTDILT